MTQATPEGAVNYGSGELFFGLFAEGTENVIGEVYIASTEEFNLNQSQEELIHYDPDHGVPEQDESAITSTESAGNFTASRISDALVSYFFNGDVSSFSQLNTPVADEVHTVQQGMWYQLGPATNGGMGVRNVSSVVVDDGAATTYVAGTDYILDAEMARIFIVTGGAIADDADIEVDYTPATESVTKVVSGTKPIVGKLFFKSFNSVGALRDVLIAKCRLSANGDFQLKGDEWQSMGFNLRALKKSDGTPNVQVQKRTAA